MALSPPISTGIVASPGQGVWLLVAWKEPAAGLSGVGSRDGSW